MCVYIYMSTSCMCIYTHVNICVYIYICTFVCIVCLCVFLSLSLSLFLFYSPLYRARALEKALGTPAKIYYKYEGVSPTGSHKPNTAVPQVHMCSLRMDCALLMECIECVLLTLTQTKHVCTSGILQQNSKP